MSEVKLTKAQRIFLRECYANRRDHGTGNGAQVYSRHDARIANNLERMGLITQPPAYTHLLGAHTTEAGRALLSLKDNANG